jgi:hypothetical protein
MERGRENVKHLGRFRYPGCKDSWSFQSAMPTDLRRAAFTFKGLYAF